MVLLHFRVGLYLYVICNHETCITKIRLGQKTIEWAETSHLTPMSSNDKPLVLSHPYY